MKTWEVLLANGITREIKAEFCEAGWGGSLVFQNKDGLNHIIIAKEAWSAVELKEPEEN